ncbi:MAG: class I SAM-dependent methyltransferase [Alphaproteobacteria bacterium]
MATLEENRTNWACYDWSCEGDEWSSPWGTVEQQWVTTVYPRIRGALPAATMLEIAPGHGRWTEFLLKHCERLYAVDIVESSVAHCRHRFGARTHASFHLNDGMSLPMIPDDSIDFVFSFDSLVHVDASVITSYLQELARKLAVGGLGFIHHSNLGAYVSGGRLMVSETHGRSPDMTAPRFAEICARTGLRCLAQETVNWGRSYLLDCFSFFGRPATERSSGDPPTLFRENSRFHEEAENAKWISSLYRALEGNGR